MAIYMPELKETKNNMWEWTPTAPSEKLMAKPELSPKINDEWKWFSKFSDDDKTRQKVILATQLIDALQTRDIADKPGKYFEKNPLLGEHPSKGDVNRYFAASMLGNYLLTKVLPPKLRPWVQNGVIRLQGDCISNNANLGVGFKF